MVTAAESESAVPTSVIRTWRPNIEEKAAVMGVGSVAAALVDKREPVPDMIQG